jgi:Tfp pilus assembly PilM family ATPase
LQHIPPAFSTLHPAIYSTIKNEGIYLNILKTYAKGCLGLAIQPETIHWVKRQSLQIKAWGCHRLPAGIFADGKVKHWNALQTELALMVAQHQLQQLPTTIALPTTLVRMQKLILAQDLSEQAIETEIYLHMQRELPGMTDTLYADFAIFPSALPTMQEIYFTVTRQEYITRYKTCVNAAGLQLKIIDIDSYALQRAVLQHLPQSVPSSTIICADINFMTLTLSDERTIITYQSRPWREGLAWLQLSLQTLRANIQHIVVCAHPEQAQLIQAEISQFSPIQYINPQTIFPSHEQKSAMSYLTAYGLTLREVPAW